MDRDTTGIFTKGHRRKRQLRSDGNTSQDDNRNGNGNFQVHINNEVIHYRNVSKSFVVHNLQISSQQFSTVHDSKNFKIFWTISYTVTDGYISSK